MTSPPAPSPKGEGESKIDPLPAKVKLSRRIGSSPVDVILFFTARATDLEKRFSSLAWPKKASGVPTDLTENDVREIGLASGLVDNKVCAVDNVWSGLRFVYRLKDRPRSSS